MQIAAAVSSQAAHAVNTGSRGSRAASLAFELVHSLAAHAACVAPYVPRAATPETPFWHLGLLLCISSTAFEVSFAVVPFTLNLRVVASHQSAALRDDQPDECRALQ
jgi:hypothetical protein